MSVEQLERSLARLKIETDEKYDALWTKYTKQMEQDAILIAVLRKQQPAEHRGPSEFTALSCYLKNAILSVADGAGRGGTEVGCAFESLFRIVTERLTPSHQDSDYIRLLREELKPYLD